MPSKISRRSSRESPSTSSTNNMRKIIYIFLIDLLISGAVAAWLYSARGVDAAFNTGLSIFVAFSPLCLILAELLPIFLAKRKFAALNIKFNNPQALKLLPEVKVVAMSYNRVLTCNKYFITDLLPTGLKQAELLTMAASAERDSEHIIGRTIYDSAVSRGLKLQKLTSTEELPGRGVETMIRGVLVRVCTPGWALSQNVSIGIPLRTKIDQLLVKGKTTLIVSTGRVTRGIIALRDEINIYGKNFLTSLRKNKIESLLLTAQPKKMAYRISKEFEIDNIRTNLTPEGKAREIQIFRAKGKIVAFIGTDTQDLPALKTADISFLLTNDAANPNEPDESKETVELNEPDEFAEPKKSNALDKATVDFKIPSLENFLTVREISIKVAELLKINRRLASVSWVVLVPPAFLTALETPPITFNPLLALAGIAIFSAIILTNSLRIKICAEKISL